MLQNSCKINEGNLGCVKKNKTISDSKKMYTPPETSKQKNYIKYMKQ